MSLNKDTGRIVKSIGRRRSHEELLFLLFFALMLFQNTFAKAFEEEESSTFNITLDPYKFRKSEKQKYFSDKSKWASRAFGTIFTPNLIIDRALSTTLHVIFDCGTCNPKILDFEYKLYPSGSWTSVGRWWNGDNEYYGTAYFIKALQPSTEYLIRAKLQSARTAAAYGKTCPLYTGYVVDLRVERVSGCWIDLRFKDPQEKCSAKYFYKYRYYTQTGSMDKGVVGHNNVTNFGMYHRKDPPGPRYVWTNPHPCPTYPKEQCLFLTEGVRPLTEYTIKIRAFRFGADGWHQDGKFSVIYVTTNSDYDLVPMVFCPPEEKTIPLWVVVLFATLIVLSIVAIVVLYELARRLALHLRKGGKEKKSKGEGKKAKKSGKDKKTKKSGKDKKAKKSGKNKKTMKPGKGKKKK